MSTNIAKPLKPTFFHQVFHPIETIQSEETTIKKVGLVALSFLIGFFSIGIVHLIFWYKDRNITVLKPDRVETAPPEEPVPSVPEAEEPEIAKLLKKRRKKAFERADEIAQRHIPSVALSLDKPPAYGEKAKLLGHLTGHQAVGGTSLEGSTHLEILTYMTEHLEKRGPGKLSQSMASALKKIKGAKELALISDQTQFKSEIVKRMESKESLLIPFGWRGIPSGHAMYLEIIHENETECTVRVFNLGAGGQYHKAADHKQMPFLDWKGVQISKFTKAPFLQAIFELNHQTDINEKERTNYSERDIYESCKKLLEPKDEKKLLTEEESPLEKWMAPQEVGICAWKSLAAFLATYLTKEEYKQLVADLKIDALVEFTKLNAPRGGEESERLFERSLSLTASYLEKQIEQGHIPEEYRKIAIEALQKSKSVWAEEKQKNLKAQQPQHELLHFKPLYGYTFQYPHLKSPNGLSQSGSSLNPISKKSIETLEAIQKASNVPLKGRFQELLKPFKKDSNLWKEEGVAIHQGLLEFMQALPLEESRWAHEISAKEAKELLSETLELANIAFGSFYGIPGSAAMQPDEVYIFRKLAHVQGVLSQIAFQLKDGERLFHPGLEEYKGALSPWDSTFNHDLKVELDLIQEKEKNIPQWPNYFGVLNQTMTLAPFWQTLKLEFPDYFRTLLEKHPNVSEPELVLKALEDTHLPDPIKALRCSGLFLKKALSSPCLDPRTNFSELQNPSSFEPQMNFKVANDSYTCQILIPPCKREVFSQAHRIGGTIEEPSYTILEKNYLENTWDLKETLVQTKEFPEKALSRWSSDEIRLLLRAFASKKTAHNDLLAYCREHPGALFEPDFQRLLIRGILKGDPGIQLTHLQNFLQEELTNLIATRSDERETAVFLLRAIRYTYSRLGSDPQMPDAHFKQIEALKKRTAGTALSRIVFLEELVCLSQKKTWSDKELLLAAQEICVLNHYPLSSIDIDPLWVFEFGKANLHMAKPLCEWIEKDPSRINAILKSLDPKAKELSWESRGDGLYVAEETGDTFSAPSARFELKKLKGKETFLPRKILENQNFQTLFPEVIRGALVEIEKTFYYEFKDPETKRASRVYLDGRIYQEFENAFWEWTPAESLYIEEDPQYKQPPKCLLGSGPLTFSCRHFRLLGKSEDSFDFISEDPKTHQILYRASCVNDPLVVECATNSRLSTPSPLFETLTHPLNIEEWYDRSRKLKRCSLKTLGLNFSPEGNHLQCEELPGFYLDLEKPKSSIIPGCPFGIVLENGKGERKLLMPRLEELTPPLNEQESLAPHFRACFSFKAALPGEERFFLYDLDPEGNLSTKNMGAELHLASVYTLFKDYKKAFALLKKQRGQLVSFNEHPALLGSLRKIAQMGSLTGDQTPEAAALATFANFLLLKNSLTYPTRKALFSVNPGALAQSYHKFLKKEHHIHAVHLLKEEELLIIDHLDPEGKNPFFSNRKDLLLGNPKKELPLPVSRESLILVPEKIDVSNFAYNSDLREQIDPLIHQKALITRPDLATHLASYYYIARGGTLEQKEWLAAALIFARQIPKEKETALALEIVLKHPDRFSAPQKRSEWSSKTADALKELFQVDPKTISFQEQVSKPFFFSPPKASHPKIPNFAFSISPLEKPFGERVDVTVQKEMQKREVPLSLEAFLNEGQKSLSPLEKAKYESLYLDQIEYKKGQEQSVQITDDLSFRKLCEDSGEAKGLLELKAEILNLANAIPEESDKLQLLKLQGGIPPFTLEELLINFARQKPELLQNHNPSLSKEGLEKLYCLLGEYLVIATDAQQKARAKKALEKGLPLEAAALATAKRAYLLDPHDKKSLAYLTFEYFSDLLLRDAQVKLQGDFIGNLEKCFAQEMIMGSGKSKVILILLALLRADGNNISTLVVASQFFKDVALHTHEILQRTFGQILATIHFDRETPITTSSLKALLGTLESVKTNENCLIVTSKTLQCLTLRFIEEWLRFSESDGKEIPPELELLKTILVKLHKEGNLLIDELDTVLNVLHTVSFSLGKKERANPALLKINQTIYEILYSSEELKALGHFESDPKPDPKAPPLTKALYNTLIKAPLAKKLLEKFDSETLKVQDQEGLVDFICQDPLLERERAKRANLAYSALDEADRELISEAALEIGHLLAATLTKTSNEKYGIPKNALFAIPYSAANAPCFGSEFASHTVTYNYTLQFVAKQGLNLAQVKIPIEEAMKRLQNNMEETEGGIEELLDKWEKKLEIPLTQKKTDFKALRKKLNEDTTLKLEFLADFIFPKMEFFSEKITSNSQNIAEIAAIMKGFTGTLWNATTFHKKFLAMAEKGTDTKTLALLFSHSNRKALEFESLSETCDVMIDAGGYFKEKKNVEIARATALQRKMPVLFYHNKVQTITNGIKETPFKDTSLKEGEYLTFLDQANTTGADTVQKPNAKGFVTIKSGMLLRDLLQAVWRLRGLAKGQTVDFVLDQKTANLIRAALTLEKEATIGLPEILRYTVANEAEQLASDNYQAFMQQIENVKQKLLTEELVSTIPPDEKKGILEGLKSSFCKPESASNPAKNFCTVPEMIDTGPYLERQLVQFEKQIALLSLTKEVKEKAIEEVKAIIERYKAPGMLLEKIQSPQATADESVEVEKETKQEVEVEVEVAKEQENEIVSLEFEGSTPTFIPVEIGADLRLKRNYWQYDVLSLGSYFEKHPQFKNAGIEKAFEGIDVSLNFLQKNKNEEERLQNYHLYASYQKEFDYVVFKDKNVTLISQEEAEKFSNDPGLFSIKSGEFLKKEQPLLTQTELEKLLKIQFLGGISSYSDEELVQIKQWLESCPKLVDFFKEVILKKNRLRALEFRGSPLAKVLKSL